MSERHFSITFIFFFRTGILIMQFMAGELKCIWDILINIWLKIKTFNEIQKKIISNSVKCVCIVVYSNRPCGYFNLLRIVKKHVHRFKRYITLVVLNVRNILIVNR